MAWLKVNGQWTNFNSFRLVYPAQLQKGPGNPWYVVAYTNEEDVYQISSEAFSTMDEALSYIDDLMKNL